MVCGKVYAIPNFPSAAKPFGFSTNHIAPYTRKNAQVVTNLQQTCSNAVPTTCQQDVFALLVPSLMSTACWQLYKLFQPLVIALQFNNYICQQVVSDNLVAT